jgi:hypothetical protein
MTASGRLQPVAWMYTRWLELTHTGLSSISSSLNENVMNFRFLLALWALCFSTAAADETADNEREAHSQNASMLRESFERPLQMELLRSGLTPRNTEIAAQNLLNSLIECWNSDRNEVTTAEPEVTIVQLGGQTIATYKTPCMNEFLADVDDVTR